MIEDPSLPYPHRVFTRLASPVRGMRSAWTPVAYRDGPPTVAQLIAALGTHARNLKRILGEGAEGVDCLQSEVNCGGTIVLVETCCEGELEDPALCAAAHARKVENACG